MIYHGNVIETILEKNWDTERVSISGFYMLNIEFNNPPYYFTKIGNGFQKASNSGSFYGYFFTMNGKNYAVEEGGVYHIEDSNKFEIKSLFFNNDDVIVTYKAEFLKESNSPIEDIIIPTTVQKENIGECYEQWIEAPALNVNYISTPSYGMIIEAREGTLLKVNDKDIVIGKTEMYSTLDTVNSLYYTGQIVLDNNRVLRKPSPELHLYLYEEVE